MVGCLVLPRGVIEAEVHRRPELADRPVAVHVRGRLCALSPAAEAAGLREGLPQGQAVALCPEVVLLPYDEEWYAALQERLLFLCAEYVPAIEPLPLTELLLDLRGVPQACSRVEELARAIAQQLGFTCCSGVAANVLVAKVVALERPGRGVARGEEARFLAPLPISRLWPVKRKVLKQLEDMGLSTIGLLQRVPMAMLTRHFGVLARTLAELAHGVDHTPLRPTYPPPRVEARAALPEATEDRAVVETMLRDLAAEVAATLTRCHQTCRRLSLRVEMEEGTCSRQMVLSHPVAEAPELRLAAQRLLSKAGPGAGVSALRLRASDLTRRTETQFSLLEERTEQTRARECLAKAISLVRRQFGEHAARWAQECEAPRRERVLAYWLGEGQ